MLIFDEVISRILDFMELVRKANAPDKFGGSVPMDDGQTYDVSDARKADWCDSPKGQAELARHRESMRIIPHGDPIKSQREGTGVWGASQNLEYHYAGIVRRKGEKLELPALAKEASEELSRWAADGFNLLYQRGKYYWRGDNEIGLWEAAIQPTVNKLHELKKELAEEASKNRNHLTVADVAKDKECDQSTVRRWCEESEFAKPKGAWRIPADKAEAWTPRAKAVKPKPRKLSKSYKWECLNCSNTVERDSKPVKCQKCNRSAFTRV